LFIIAGNVYCGGSPYIIKELKTDKDIVILNKNFDEIYIAVNKIDNDTLLIRISTGIIQAELDEIKISTGIIQAELDKVRISTHSPDNFGSHIATTNVVMSGFDITDVSSVNVVNKISIGANNLDEKIHASSSSNLRMALTQTTQDRTWAILNDGWFYIQQKDGAGSYQSRFAINNGGTYYLYGSTVAGRTALDEYLPVNFMGQTRYIRLSN